MYFSLLFYSIQKSYFVTFLINMLFFTISISGIFCLTLSFHSFNLNQITLSLVHWLLSFAHDQNDSSPIFINRNHSYFETKFCIFYPIFSCIFIHPSWHSHYAYSVYEHVASLLYQYLVPKHNCPYCNLVKLFFYPNRYSSIT